MIDHQEPAYKQIRNLLMVLTLGVACAAILSGFFLYYYGPTGIYKLNTVMLEPSLVDSLSYNDQDAKTGKPVRFAFEKTEFSYWSQPEQTWKKAVVSLDLYQQFYHRFGDEKSIAEPSNEVLAQFLRQPPAKLTIGVQQASDNPNSPSKVFQEVQFANEGDFYRVTLHEQDNNGWAYFYHPHIYSDVMSTFLGERTNYE